MFQPTLMYVSPGLGLDEAMSYRRVNGEYVLQMVIPGTGRTPPAFVTLSIPKFWQVVPCNPLEGEKYE